jgi:hypothetical protein
MSQRDVDLDGSEDENASFALDTIFTVSRKSLSSVLQYHQHLRVVAFVIAILPTILFHLTIRTPAPVSA